MTLDPALSAVKDTVSFDRVSDKLSFEEEVIEGDSLNAKTKSLALYIYAHFHAGKVIEDSSNSDLASDPILESRIIDQSPIKWRHNEYEILKTMGSPEGIIVSHDRLNVFVPKHRIIEQSETSAKVQLAAIEPRLSTGFLFFSSRYGKGDLSTPLRIYRHARNPDDLLPVWSELVSRTDSWKLPIRAKILSRAHEYPRRDALVVYLPREAWPRLDEIVSLLAGSDDSPEASTFTKNLGYGVAASWEPIDGTIGRRHISFGEHRSEAIAEGLVEDLVEENLHDEKLIARLHRSNIDPTRVYRNVDSPTVV